MEKATTHLLKYKNVFDTFWAELSDNASLTTATENSFQEELNVTYILLNFISSEIRAEEGRYDEAQFLQEQAINSFISLLRNKDGRTNK